MRKKSPLFIALLLSTAGLFLSSCNDNNGCVDGNGQIRTITVGNIGLFSGIVFSGAANINIVKGSIPSIAITGESNIINQFSFNVSGSDLFIDSDGCYSTSEDITITVTTSKLDKIEISGSGNVLSSDPFQAENFEAILSGSGNIAVKHQAFIASTIRLEGSGNIFLEGSSKAADLSITGSGNIEAFNYPLANCAIRISESGNGSVTVGNNLDVDISGSGNVFYKGNPQINTTITGSGSVINAN